MTHENQGPNAEKDAIRWVVFCAMYPGEERLFNDRSTSELRRMNSKAAGIADALWIAGARVEADQTHPIPPVQDEGGDS